MRTSGDERRWAGGDWMSRLGADTDDLERLAKALDRASESLEDDRQQVGRTIRATRWDGPDAGRFRSEWDGRHGPTLRDAAQSFAVVARTVRAEAKAQRQASGEDGASGPGTPPTIGPWDGTPPGDGTSGDDTTVLDAVATWGTVGGLGVSAYDSFVLKPAQLVDTLDELRPLATNVDDLGKLRAVGDLTTGFNVLGAVTGGFQLYEGVKNGDPYYAADGGITAALSVGAMIPGVDVVAAPAAAIWGGASLINGMLSDEPLTKNIADGIGHVGDAISDVGDFLGF